LVRQFKILEQPAANLQDECARLRRHSKDVSHRLTVCEIYNSAHIQLISTLKKENGQLQETIDDLQNHNSEFQRLVRQRDAYRQEAQDLDMKLKNVRQGIASLRRDLEARSVDLRDTAEKLGEAEEKL
jgi:peptidoglycan hydrolase CwlO-like protein